MADSKRKNPPTGAGRDDRGGKRSKVCFNNFLKLNIIFHIIEFVIIFGLALWLFEGLERGLIRLFFAILHILVSKLELRYFPSLFFVSSRLKYCLLDPKVIRISIYI